MKRENKEDVNKSISFKESIHNSNQESVQDRLYTQKIR